MFSRLTIRTALCSAVLWACLPLTAVAETAAEVTVKAAVVHKIAKFVTWPESAFESADAPMRFCVVGTGGIFDALQRIGDRPVQGRKVVVRRAPEPELLAQPAVGSSLPHGQPTPKHSSSPGGAGWSSKT